MAPEMDFFIFLLEQYARHRGVTGDVILKEWDALGLTDGIYRMYDVYHVEAVENAFADIDRLVKEKKTA